ncbi:MAG: hypothetical protein RL722_2002 [Pseudomonadota bacterium]|jgi:hypothetical protein
MTSTPIPGAMPVPAPAPGPQTYRLIREERAAKLGARSTCGVIFQVLADEARQALFLRIARNEGGGYINNEAVSLHAILTCLQAVGDHQIKAASFITAFRGRSSNNPGAMAAVLVHEKLIKRHPERPHLFDDGEVGWADWATRQLAVGGDLPIVTVGKASQAPVASTEKKKRTKKAAAPIPAAAPTPAAADGDEAGDPDTGTPDVAADADAPSGDDTAPDAEVDVAAAAPAEAGTSTEAATSDESSADAADDTTGDAAADDEGATTGPDVSRVKVRRKGRITLKG